MKLATMVVAIAAVAAVVVPTGQAAARPEAPEAPVVIDAKLSVAEVVSQLERESGRPLGKPTTAIAVDAGDRPLTVDEIGAVYAGKLPSGVRLLGAVKGGLADASIGDASDGVIDGVAARQSSSFGGFIFGVDSWQWGVLTCWWTYPIMMCAIVDTFGPPPQD